MLAVDDTYKSIISGNDYATKIRLEIDGHTFEEDQIISLKTSRSVFDGDSPAVGKSVSGEIEVEMINPDYTFSRTAKIVLYTAVTDGTRTSSFIQNGIYYIDTRKITYNYATDDTITIKGYDIMMKFEQPYELTDISYPVADGTLLQKMCDKIGVTIENSTKSKLSGRYTIKDPSDYTYREVLNFIAAGYSGNFVISADEKLRFLMFNHVSRTDISHDTYDLGTNASEVSSSDTLKGYSCVYIEDGYDDNGDPKRYYKYDTSQFSNFDDAKKNGQVLKIENDIINDDDSTDSGDQQKMVDYVYNDIKGWTYLPYEAKEAILPMHVEIGDKVIVGIHPNETIESGVYSMEVEYGPLTVTELKAPYDEEMDHEFSYESKSKRKSSSVESTAASTASGVSSLGSYTGIAEAEADEEADPDDETAGTKISLYQRLNDNLGKVYYELYDESEGVNAGLHSVIAKTGIGSLPDTTTMYSEIDIQAGTIDALVGPDFNGSGFSWHLSPDGFYLYSAGTLVMRINASSTEVKGSINTSQSVAPHVLSTSSTGSVNINADLVRFTNSYVSWQRYATCDFSASLSIGDSSSNTTTVYRVNPYGDITEASGFTATNATAGAISIGGDATFSMPWHLGR